MFAVIETGGKQYKVSEGDVIRVEKLNEENGATVNFNVLTIGGEAVKVGNPYVDGAKVEGTVLETGKGKKIYILKYKAKKNEKKKIGHRQSYTKVKITKIEG